MRVWVMLSMCCLLSGCVTLGKKESQVQEAYYVPVILPDSYRGEQPPIINRSDQGPQSNLNYPAPQYSPVIQ